MTIATHHAILTVTTPEATVSIAGDELTINQVARLVGLHVDILRHLVRYGVISGQSELCDLDEARAVAGQLAAARAGLEGVGIIVTEAVEKYGFADNTIYNWHAAGWVKVLGIDKSDHRLFNEADIAFARKLADLIGHTPGRAVFPPKPRSGRPRKK